MAGNIIHLIGFRGVGKLTIAKEIVRHPPDFVLVDNHLVNNAVFAVVKADGKTPLPAEIWAKASQIRAIVFDTMETLAPPQLSFVMTNFAVEDEEDKAECRKIEAVAEQRGGHYFPVILTWDVEENRRVVAPRARSPVTEEHAPPDHPGLGLAGLGNPAGREQPSDQLAALMERLLFHDVQLLVREFRFNVLEQHR